MKYKFLGYGKEKPYYDDGKFTVGEIYEMKEGSFNSFAWSDLEPDAKFIDDRGSEIREDLKYFKQVDEKGTP